MTRQIGAGVASPYATKVGKSGILRRALAWWGGDKTKWHKGDFHSTDGTGSCALGAVLNVVHEDDLRVEIKDWREAEQAVIKELKNMHPRLVADTIPDLNDSPDVSFEDMTAAFEKAALKFEEKGE